MAVAYSKANDDRADAYANSQASWLTDWTWNGPPEEAPGGNLTWGHNAGGSTTDAWGYNTTSGISISSAEANSWTFGTEGSAWADIDVWGLIGNGSVDGGWDQVGSPDEDLVEGYEDSETTPPDYYFWIEDWEFQSNDVEPIASGTTYIYFTGGISCDVDTTAFSTEEKIYWAEAHAEVIADNDVWAGFVPNE